MHGYMLGRRSANTELYMVRMNIIYGACAWATYTAYTFPKFVRVTHTHISSMLTNILVIIKSTVDNLYTYKN